LNSVIDQIGKRLKDLQDPQCADSQRLFHGRGRLVPGFEQVTVDLFAPVLWVTFFKAPEAADFEANLLQALAQLADRFGLAAVAVQRRYLKVAADCVWGELPKSMVARRGEARFHIQLGENQNTGYFLDMEPGRRWLEQRAADKKILNLFAFTCAFSVVGQMAAAREVVNVDMSRGALNRGRDNHRLNGLDTSGIAFMQENILKSWGRIRRRGPFDIAVLDPPSFQRGSFEAQKDYRKLVRRLPELLVDGGDALLCLNSPQLSVSFLQELVEQECPACRFIERLAPSPDFPDRDPDQQLKLLHFQYHS
jgi:23S rRNA (cytosine1962-C5)-methyltransferase